MNLTSFSIIAALVNFLTMLGNVYWGFKLSSIKGTGELTNYWKSECEKKDNQLAEKDTVIRHMLAKKNQLKYQYQQQLALNKDLEGQLTTYKKLYNH